MTVRNPGLLFSPATADPPPSESRCSGRASRRSLGERQDRADCIATRIPSIRGSRPWELCCPCHGANEQKEARYTLVVVVACHNKSTSCQHAMLMAGSQNSGPTVGGLM